jgi:hypothetical protein
MCGRSAPERFGGPAELCVQVTGELCARHERGCSRDQQHGCRDQQSEDRGEPQRQRCVTVVPPPRERSETQRPDREAERTWAA